MSDNLVNPQNIFVTRDEAPEAEVVLRFNDKGRPCCLDMDRPHARKLIELLQAAVDVKSYPAGEKDPIGDALARAHGLPKPNVLRLVL